MFFEVKMQADRRYRYDLQLKLEKTAEITNLEEEKR